MGQYRSGEFACTSFSPNLHRIAWFQLTITVGEDRGMWTPYPRGSTPYPRPIFSSLPPPPFFPYFFFGYPRPKFRFLASAPSPSHPRPPPIFRQKPPYPRPLNPRAPDPPVLLPPPPPPHITVTSKWAPWHLKSLLFRLIAQPFVQARIKENTNAPRHWPLWGESTGDRWNPPHKRPITRKMFPFDDVIMQFGAD